MIGKDLATVSARAVAMAGAYISPQIRVKQDSIAETGQTGTAFRCGVIDEELHASSHLPPSTPHSFPAKVENM